MVVYYPFSPLPSNQTDSESTVPLPVYRDVVRSVQLPRLYLQTSLLTSGWWSADLYALTSTEFLHLNASRPSTPVSLLTPDVCFDKRWEV